MQYPPECSTCPEARCYVDQLLTIDLLSYYIPSDVVVYVKEYPKQTSVGRSPVYYDRIRSYKNVRMIRTDVSTYDLIDKALFVCTGSGSAGLEAVARGKPAVIFGSAIYQFAPGIFPVKTTEELKHAINRILHKDYSIDQMDVKRFLQFLYQESIECMLEPSFESYLKISHEQNSDNVLQAIKGIIA